MTVAMPASWATIVETEGEAAIQQGDMPSARLEATARARWKAVEAVAGVHTSAATVISNFVLLDETVIQRANGVIRWHEVLQEGQKGDVYAVKIRADVGLEPAQAAVRQVARNKALAVYVRVQLPGWHGPEDSAITTALLQQLTDEGYDVIDVAVMDSAAGNSDAEQMILHGEIVSVDMIRDRYLANAFLVGSVSTKHVGRRGTRDGMGTLPFEVVAAEMSYRLLSGGEEDQVRTVLASGRLSEKGAGADVESAARKAVTELSRAAVPKILERVRSAMRATRPKIRIRVDGVGTLADDSTVRETIRNIAWVENLTEEGLGKYVVDYPERTLYLAASLHNKVGFRVVDVTGATIQARFEGVAR